MIPAPRVAAHPSLSRALSSERTIWMISDLSRGGELMNLLSNPSRDFVVNQQRPQSVKGASATAPRPSIERNGVVPLRNALPATTKPVSLTGIGQRTTSQTPGDSVLPRRMATAIESRSVTSGSETIGTYRRKKPDAIPPHASRNKSENIAVAHAGTICDKTSNQHVNHTQIAKSK